jgi:hemolysin D
MFTMLKYRFQAAREVLSHYRKSFRLAWRFRHTMETPKRNRDEADFLPSALAVQEKPVSSIARWTAWLIIGIIIFLLVWSYFGKLDIVVMANGKVITSSATTQNIASLEPAKIHSILVKEGQKVKAGDVLMELDASSLVPEVDKASLEYQDALANSAKSRAVLQALDSLSPPRVANDPRLSSNFRERAQGQADSIYEDIRAKIDRANNDFARYSEAADMFAKRAQDMKPLVDSGDVSRHELLDMIQREKEVRGQANDARKQREMIISESRKAAFEELGQAERIANASNQDAKKGLARTNLLRLTAPVDGVVQQIRFTTVGGIVPSAEPIMQIVPSTEAAEVEAMVENKDIGYIKIGAPVAVKIQTYEYTRYGTIPGRVTFVGQDAVEDKDGVLTFPARIALERSYLDLEGRRVQLSAGMSVTADIKTGDRSIIAYFLSPLQQHKAESLNER